MREEGNPIISTAEWGKGYALVDPNDFMSPDHWDSKFLANERREDIPKTERKIDEILFVRCLAQCTNPTIRKRLKVIAEKYSIRTDINPDEELKKEKKSEDEDEEKE